MRVCFCIFLFFCLSCSKSNSDSREDCVSILIDESKFNANENGDVNFLEYTLDGYCLEVKLGVTGCDDNIDMIYDGNILKSLPPQVIFDFYNNNTVICESYYVLEGKYDLSSLFDYNTDEIVIRFRNSDISFTLIK